MAIIIKNNLLRIKDSFRVRLFLIMAVLGLGASLVLSEMIFRSYGNSLIEQKASELKYTFSIAADQLDGGTVSEAMTDEVKRELNLVCEYLGSRMLIVDAAYRIVFDSYSVSADKYCISEAIVNTFHDDAYLEYQWNTGYLEFALPLRTASSTIAADNTINGVMIVSSSVSWIADMMESMNTQVRLFQAGCAVIVLAAAFVLSGVLVSPWKKVLNTLSQILEGDLNARFTINGGYRETTEIIDTFNQILGRMQTLDASRQEFVSNVSHELKTPITSMRVLADSLLTEEKVPVEIYREFMGDISEEIDRETKIINDLLSLVRLDKNATSINIAPVNINDMIEQTLKRLRPIAKQRNIEIIYESFRSVTADVDETKFSLALNNLVENGVKYNNDGGWVRVSLNADHKFLFIKVADSGVGIPEDARERIFERFYRVDKARSRETGGTGLGLAITKSVILLHHGAIRVESEPGKGTVFTVRIPLKYVA